MEMIITAHEPQVKHGQEHQLNKQGSITRISDKPDITKGLYTHINERDLEMAHAQLIGHDLIGMFLMRCHEVLTQEDAMEHGQTTIDRIDHNERHPIQLGLLEEQLEDEEQDDKANRQSPHIAGKALGMRAEIEETEHEDGHEHEHEQIIIDKMGDKMVDIDQRQDGHQGIATRHAIDTIHEIIDIHHAHTGHRQKEQRL